MSSTIRREKATSSWISRTSFLAAFCLIVFAAGQARAQFELFDNAKEVVGGTGPNNAAVDLTSECTVFTGPTCSFATFTDSGVSLTPKKTMVLADITTLSSDYNIGASDCGGGSPRFSIGTSLGPNKNIFVYFGPFPNFTGCFFGWQNTGNVVNATDGRWDTSQICSGTQQNTHAGALSCLASVGNPQLTSVSVVVDGGWKTGPQGQDITIDNFTVNDSVMNGENAK